MDSILQQLAYYKRHDPASMEEQELMENLFDVLCALLLYTPNRDLFLRAEGLQLMNLMLREKKTSRYVCNCTGYGTLTVTPLLQGVRTLNGLF